MTNDEKFFFEHAGFSYDPKTETPEQGKLRCAQELAKAEAWARNNDVAFRWSVDEDCDSSSFSNKRPRWQLWQCAAYRDGEFATSIGAVDFGRDRDPWMDPYRRVIEAELAAEIMKE